MCWLLGHRWFVAFARPYHRAPLEIRWGLCSRCYEDLGSVIRRRTDSERVPPFLDVYW